MGKAEGMTQWLKCLPQKCEAWSSDPQNRSKHWVGLAAAVILALSGRPEILRGSWLLRLARSESSGFEQ